MKKGAEVDQLDFREVFDYAKKCEEKIRKMVEELKNKINGELDIMLRPYATWQERNSENGEIIHEIPDGMNRINFKRVGMSFKVLCQGNGDILELFEAAFEEPNTKNIFQIYEQIDLALKEVSEC